MDNPYLRKGLALAGALVRSPSVIPAYLRHLPCWGGGPIDRALPWISFGALQFLDRYLRPVHDVFEFGGGGSTIYFAQRARSVLTMENHPDWHAVIQRTLAARGLTNVCCEFHPITGDAPNQFRGDAFFHRVSDGQWDVILIDCYCGYSASRYGYLRPFAFELAHTRLKPGGIIVLDDSWMFPELLQSRAGWRIINFTGPGPCRYGVTATSILQRLP